MTREVWVTLLLTWSAYGFAAPVPSAPVPDPLAWGYLGIRVENLSLRVAGVEPNTPAAKAGLEAGDELVRVGHLRPRAFAEVAEHIRSFRPGSTLRVEVRRGSEEKAFTVRLAARPDDLDPPPIRVPAEP